jgi:hypothetical protein
VGGGGGEGESPADKSGRSFSERGEEAVRRTCTRSGPGRESARAQSVSRTVPPLKDALGAPESESQVLQQMIMSLIFDKGKLREGLSVYEWVSGMDEGTLKTPIPQCRLYWSF